MFRFTPYILKNLKGHPFRTILTVGSAALLMFLFIFVSSLQEGLDHLLEKREDRQIVFQAYRFCPSSSNLPMYYKDTILADERVRDVLPVRVHINNCRASLDTIVFHGTESDALKRLRKFQFIAGSWDTFQSRGDAALVGRRVAERRGLSTGKMFTAAGVSVNVQAIFSSEDADEENVIYVHLPLLQKFKGGNDQDLNVTLFEVYPHDPAQGDSVAGAIDDRIRTKFQIPTETKPASAYYQRALADLVDIIGFTRWLGLVSIVVVAVMIGNSVIMSVQDRVKEHAVLQTIGYTGNRIFFIMLAESLILSIVGGILGVMGCYIWLNWQPISITAEGVSVDFVASFELLGWGMGLAALIGFLAGLVPAWQAGRAEIVESLR